MSVERKREDEEKLEEKAVNSSIVISSDAVERLKRIHERVEERKDKVADIKEKREYRKSVDGSLKRVRSNEEPDKNERER